MIQFNNITELSDDFRNGEFILEQTFTIGNDVFTLAANNKVTITEAIAGKQPLALYVSETTDSQIIMIWKMNQANAIIPVGASLTDKHFTDKMKTPTQDLVVEMNGEKIVIRPDQLIGDIAMVKFTSLSSPKELQGKTDTGATISSLHADHYKINGNTVTFTCQPLGPNSITVPLKTQHAVKSPDGGTVYRPVIVLNVKVNGKLLNNVEFNLNDRGNMDQPVLIGQNLLQAGKFYVDPSRNEGLTVENMDWEQFENIISETKVANKDPQVIADLYQKMLESNVNFGDLVRHIKSEVTKTDIEY